MEMKNNSQCDCSSCGVRIPIMYYDELSPQARSCYMLIKVLHIDIDLRSVSSTFNKIKLYEMAPTFVDGKLTLSGGHTIMVYLCDKYACVYLPHLCPCEYLTRLQLLNMLFYEAGILNPRLRNMLTEILLKKYPNVDMDYHQRMVVDSYNTLEAYLKGHTFLVGNCLTIADFSMITTVSSLHLIVPICKEHWPNLHRWLENLKNMEFYKYNQDGIEKQCLLLETVGECPFPITESALFVRSSIHASVKGNKIQLSSRTERNEMNKHNDEITDISKKTQEKAQENVFKCSNELKKYVLLKETNQANGNNKTAPLISTFPSIKRTSTREREELLTSVGATTDKSCSSQPRSELKKLFEKTIDSRSIPDSEEEDIIDHPKSTYPQMQEIDHINEYKDWCWTKDHYHNHSRIQTPDSNMKCIEFECVMDAEGNKCYILKDKRSSSKQHSDLDDQCACCSASMPRDDSKCGNSVEGMLREFKSCFCISNNCELTCPCSQRNNETVGIIGIEAVSKRPVSLEQQEECEDDYIESYYGGGNCTSGGEDDIFPSDDEEKESLSCCDQVPTEEEDDSIYGCDEEQYNANDKTDESEACCNSETNNLTKIDGCLDSSSISSFTICPCDGVQAAIICCKDNITDTKADPQKSIICDDQEFTEENIANIDIEDNCLCDLQTEMDRENEILNLDSCSSPNIPLDSSPNNLLVVDCIELQGKNASDDSQNCGCEEGYADVDANYNRHCDEDNLVALICHCDIIDESSLLCSCHPEGNGKNCKHIQTKHSNSSADSADRLNGQLQTDSKLLECSCDINQEHGLQIDIAQCSTSARTFSTNLSRHGEFCIGKCCRSAYKSTRNRCSSYQKEKVLKNPDTNLTYLHEKIDNGVDEIDKSCRDPNKSSSSSEEVHSHLQSEINPINLKCPSDVKDSDKCTKERNIGKSRIACQEYQNKCGRSDYKSTRNRCSSFRKEKELKNPNTKCSHEDFENGVGEIDKSCRDPNKSSSSSEEEHPHLQFNPMDLKCSSDVKDSGKCTKERNICNSRKTRQECQNKSNECTCRPEQVEITHPTTEEITCQASSLDGNRSTFHSSQTTDIQGGDQSKLNKNSETLTSLPENKASEENHSEFLNRVPLRKKRSSGNRNVIEKSTIREISKGEQSANLDGAKIFLDAKFPSKLPLLLATKKQLSGEVIEKATEREVSIEKQSANLVVAKISLAKETKTPKFPSKTSTLSATTKQSYREDIEKATEREVSKEKQSANLVGAKISLSPSNRESSINKKDIGGTNVRGLSQEKKSEDLATTSLSATTKQSLEYRQNTERPKAYNIFKPGATLEDKTIGTEKNDPFIPETYLGKQKTKLKEESEDTYVVKPKTDKQPQQASGNRDDTEKSKGRAFLRHPINARPKSGLQREAPLDRHKEQPKETQEVSDYQSPPNLSEKTAEKKTKAGMNVRGLSKEKQSEDLNGVKISLTRENKAPNPPSVSTTTEQSSQSGKYIESSKASNISKSEASDKASGKEKYDSLKPETYLGKPKTKLKEETEEDTDVMETKTYKQTQQTFGNKDGTEKSTGREFVRHQINKREKSGIQKLRASLDRQNDETKEVQEDSDYQSSSNLSEHRAHDKLTDKKTKSGYINQNVENKTGEFDQTINKVDLKYDKPNVAKRAKEGQAKTECNKSKGVSTTPSAKNGSIRSSEVLNTESKKENACKREATKNTDTFARTRRSDPRNLNKSPQCFDLETRNSSENPLLVAGNNKVEVECADNQSACNDNSVTCQISENKIDIDCAPCADQSLDEEETFSAQTTKCTIVTRKKIICSTSGKKKPACSKKQVDMRTKRLRAGSSDRKPESVNHRYSLNGESVEEDTSKLLDLLPQKEIRKQQFHGLESQDPTSKCSDEEITRISKISNFNGEALEKSGPFKNSKIPRLYLPKYIPSS